MTIRNDQVLDVFRELSGHRGCSREELDAAQRELGVSLPKRYREMMRFASAAKLGALKWQISRRGEVIATVLPLHA